MEHQQVRNQYTITDYVLQLVKDVDTSIAKSSAFFKRFAYKNGTDVNEEFVPSYKCEGVFKMSELFEISQQALPQTEKLNDEDVAQLAKKLEQLWNAYHFQADFPNALPIRQKYTLMREKWNCEVKLASRGETHIEFCHHEPKNCRFNGYCTICNDLKDED